MSKKYKIVIAVILAIVLLYFFFPVTTGTKFSFVDYEIIADDTYINLSVTNTNSFFGKAGYPDLPAYSTKILIPSNRIVLFVNVICSEPETVDLDKEIYPFQEPIIGEESFFVKYDYGDNFTIGKRHSDWQVLHSKGYPILHMNLYPFDYKGGKLYVYKNFEVKVTTTLGWNNQFLRNTEYDKKSLSIDNLETLDTYERPLLSGYSGGICDRDQKYEYIIVCNRDTNNTNGIYNLQDLLDYRKDRDGLNGFKIAWEDIDVIGDYWGKNPVEDEASHLREFLKDAYLDWGTEYVILFGVWRSGDRGCPWRIFEVPEWEDKPYPNGGPLISDIYFSHLDGNWYNDTESCFGTLGEDVFDFGRELYIGRIPSSSLSGLSVDLRVSNIVKKIIKYESQTTTTWRKLSAWSSEESSGFDAKNFVESVRLGLTDYPSDFVDYNNKNPSTQIDMVPFHTEDFSSETNCINAWLDAINNNQVAFVACNVKHGDSYHFIWYDPYSRVLTNTEPFFAISNSCFEGDARYSSAMEHLFNQDIGLYGAVAQTGYGWLPYDPERTSAFWAYMLENDGGKLGVAFEERTNGLNYFNEKERYLLYSNHLWGDPATNFAWYTDEEPLTVKCWSCVNGDSVSEVFSGNECPIGWYDEPQNCLVDTDSVPGFELYLIIMLFVSIAIYRKRSQKV